MRRGPTHPSATIVHALLISAGLLIGADRAIAEVVGGSHPPAQPVDASERTIASQYASTGPSPASAPRDVLVANEIDWTCVAACVLCAITEGAAIGACAWCAICGLGLGGGAALSAAEQAQMNASHWLSSTIADVDNGIPPDQAIAAHIPAKAPGHAWRIERHPTQISIFNRGSALDTALVFALRDSSGALTGSVPLTPAQAVVAVPAGGQVVVSLPPEAFTSHAGIAVASATGLGRNGDGSWFSPEPSVPASNAWTRFIALFSLATLGGWWVYRRRLAGASQA